MEKACVPCFMKVNYRKLMLWQDDSILMNKITEKLSSLTVALLREFFLYSTFVFLAFFTIKSYQRVIIREIGFGTILWTIKIPPIFFQLLILCVLTLCAFRKKIPHFCDFCLLKGIIKCHNKKQVYNSLVSSKEQCPKEIQFLVSCLMTEFSYILQAKLD